MLLLASYDNNAPMLAEKRHVGGPYGGKIVRYDYTDTCQVESITDDRGVESFEYDLRDRLTKRTQPDGAVLEYQYDAGGNTKRRTERRGASVTVLDYEHDALGRMSALTRNGVRFAEYAYDATGNLVEIHDLVPNAKSALSYDKRNRLLDQSVRDSAGALVARFAYTLDAAGNRLAVDEIGGRFAYEYDSAYRLTRETRTGTGAYDIAYTYDAVGNRLTKTEGGSANTYIYDTNDRLLTAGATTYSWDDAGRLLTAGGQTYAWDPEDRLRLADGTGMEYGDNGLRSKVGTEDRLVDTQQGFGNLASAGANEFTFGLGLVHMNVGGQSRWVIADALGSVRMLLDDSGTVTDTFTYSAFGELVHRTGSTPLVFGFAGEEYDAATGFYYLRARHYDPSLGRFLSMDPVEGKDRRPLSHHDYTYAGLNPVMNSDPEGTEYTMTETVNTQNLWAKIQKMYQANRVEAWRQVKAKAKQALKELIAVAQVAVFFESIDMAMSELGERYPVINQYFEGIDTHLAGC